MIKPTLKIDQNNISEVAANLLVDYFCGEVKIVRIAKCLGFSIFESKLKDNHLGFVTSGDKRINKKFKNDRVIVLNERIDGYKNRRYTLARLLSECLVAGGDGPTYYVCTADRINNPSSIVNNFVCELMMPKFVFQKICSNYQKLGYENQELISLLSDYFMMPKEIIMDRYIDLSSSKTQTCDKQC